MSFAQQVKKELIEYLDIATDMQVDQESQLAHAQRLALAHLFLRTGSITDPNKDYHLEFLHPAQEIAQETLELLHAGGLKAKLTQRKNSWLVYIKDAESIGEFLGLVSAHESLMAFLNVRILKDISAHINRKVNLETANLNKTISAAVEQEQHIRFLLDEHPMALSPDLLAIAYARLDNLDATLLDIANSFEPPLSKSCVNHRLRKIRKLAQTLQQQ